MDASAAPTTETRQCAFCGKTIPAHLNQCPSCREMVPEVLPYSPKGKTGSAQIRRGLLYMLLAAVVYYLAGGYGTPPRIPSQIVPLVNNYLLPLLFLGGVGLCVYGLILHAKS